MSGNANVSKTVLLVDDLDSLRTMLRDFLESMGLRVLQASNAAEAIQIARSHLGKIDLLLSDIEMPGMSGWESAKKIAGLKPGIRVLYMSAGVSLEDSNSGSEIPFGAYLIAKPFRLEELKILVMSILEK